MFRTLVRTSLAILVVALVASRASAATFEGKAVAVGATKLTMVDKNGGNQEVSTTSSTKITLDGKPAKLTDIEVGDVVKVTADKKDGDLVAKEIEARSTE
jgi:hypothetical protein